MKKPSYHTVLFAILMVALCLPLVQHFGHVFKFKELGGYTAPLEPVKWSWQTCRDQSWQDYEQKFLQQNFGFRNLYIRAYNQFYYSLFHQTTNQNMVIGKHGELFLRQYTDVFTGKTLRDRYGTVDSARAAMQTNVLETRRVADSLKKYGTELIVVLAPSKPLIYPEYLPDDMQREHNPFSIQEEYAKLYAHAGIEHINFVPVFRQMKATEPYPLYTKYGTHWAYSTIPFVADTILQKIASVKGYAMPHAVCMDSNVSVRYFGSDKELEEQLNLLFPLRHERIPTPKFTLQGESKSQKPNLLVIGDSYFTQLEKTDFVKAFRHVDYWKYNETAYSTRPNCSGNISYLNRYEILTEADVVLVVFTDMHAFDYFFGFIKTVDRTLEDGPDFDPEKAILAIIERIKATPEWYEKVKEQAKEKGISLEQCLRENAQWVFEQDRR